MTQLHSTSLNATLETGLKIYKTMYKLQQCSFFFLMNTVFICLLSVKP